MDKKGGVIFMEMSVMIVTIVGALTEDQAKIILFCLGLAILLLVIGFVKVWDRLGGIEESVDAATENVQELKKKVEALGEIPSEETT